MKKIHLMNMKWLAVLFVLPLLTSCLEDLPAYDEAKITKVGFYHRFAGPDTDVLTGEPIMVERELTCSSVINEETEIIEVKVTVPEANAQTGFTEAERGRVTQSNLWGYVTLSTAAKISPLSGTNRLGTADDWTKEHQFEVTAANGDKRTWTIRVVEFKK